MDDLSSVDRGPRQSDNASQTGTGSPRSADDGVQQAGATPDREPTSDERTEAIAGTTSSHPAEADDLHVNRSGSGGSTGASTSEPELEGSESESMEEMLGGAEGSDH